MRKKLLLFAIVIAFGQWASGSESMTFRHFRVGDFGNPDQTICPGEEVICILNETPPEGAKIRWEPSEHFVFFAGEVGKPYAWYKAVKEGVGVIKITVESTTGSFTAEKEIHIGTPVKEDLSDYPVLLQSSQWVELTSGLQGALTYDWQFTEGKELCTNYSFNDNIAGFLPGEAESGTKQHFLFTVEGKNRCGSARDTVSAVLEKNAGLNLKAGDRGSFAKEIVFEEPVALKLYSLSGMIMYSEKEVISFNITDLPVDKGIYILEIGYSGGKTESLKVFKN